MECLARGADQSDGKTRQVRRVASRGAVLMRENLLVKQGEKVGRKEGG